MRGRACDHVVMLPGLEHVFLDLGIAEELEGPTRHVEHVAEGDGRGVRKLRVPARERSVERDRARYQYSNTNYLLLGRILEKVTGESYARLLRREILDPVGLTSTFLSGYEATIGPVRPGHTRDTSGNFAATKFADDTLMWAAGSLVSSANDMARWFDALFSGAVVSSDTLTLMVTQRTLKNGSKSPYGLGFEITMTSAGPLYSKGGGGECCGIAAQVAYLPSQSSIVAVIANTGNVPLADVNGAIWRTVLGP